MWDVWTDATGNYARCTQKYLRKGNSTSGTPELRLEGGAHAVERDLIARAPGPH
jgi:hypothetical protein